MSDFIAEILGCTKEELEGLSLRDLDLPIGRMFNIERLLEQSPWLENVKNEYEKEYGEDWYAAYTRDRTWNEGRDDVLTEMNQRIRWGMACGVHLTMPVCQEEFPARERAVYGGRYEELHEHLFPCEEVDELLIQDALRTGKWRELPGDLQVRYHERALAERK